MTDEQLAELRRLASKATTPPWRVATDADVDDNWLVGFGRSVHDNQTYYVTTDHVHASELEGDAKTDAEFVAACRTAVPKLLDALDSQSVELRDEMIRGQRAEQLLMVYRVLLTGAMIAASGQAGVPLGAKPFADGYFGALFEVALDSGAFAQEGCGSWAIMEAAKQLRIDAPTTSAADAMQELREKFGHYFDAIEDVDEWVRQQRRGEDA